jgi:hypothetical protein
MLRDRLGMGQGSGLTIRHVSWRSHDGGSISSSAKRWVPEQDGLVRMGRPDEEMARVQAILFLYVVKGGGTGIGLNVVRRRSTVKITKRASGLRRGRLQIDQSKINK